MTNDKKRWSKSSTGRVAVTRSKGERVKATKNRNIEAPGNVTKVGSVNLPKTGHPLLFTFFYINNPLTLSWSELLQKSINVPLVKWTYIIYDMQNYFN